MKAMKYIVMCLCLLFGHSSFGSRDLSIISPSPSFDDIYFPGLYINYDSSVVYTTQLKVNEYQLQRLDCLLLNASTIKDKLGAIDDKLFKIDSINNRLECYCPEIVKELNTVTSDMSCVVYKLNELSKYEKIFCWCSLIVLSVIVVLLSILIVLTYKSFRFLKQCAS